MVEEQREFLEQIEQLLESTEHVGLGALLEDKRTSDIAEVVEILDNEQRRIIFDLLDRAKSAEVLEKVDEATRSELFELLGDKLADLIAELDPDDAADVLAELPEDESQEVLEHIPADDAEQIKDLMSYSEDSAGGIMDPAVLSVHEDATVREAIEQIRAAEVDEDFFNVFVINRHGQFLGDVRLRSLIIPPADTQIKQFIDTDTIYVRVDTDQEEVRNIFKKNDLIVVPVLDNNNVLVGRITADRVIEVAEEEAAEDMYVMAGTDAAELENISTFHAARVRMTWLLPCLAGTAVTALIGLFFRTIFFQADHLFIFLTAVVFSPMIAAISGNAGLQTSAIVVCGLATGDLAALKIEQVFMREVRIALLVALCCGIIGGFVCGFLPELISIEGISSGQDNVIQAAQSTALTDTTTGHTDRNDHLRIAAAFAIAMFSAIMVSTTLGLFLPFLFRRIGIDPAISSGPLVTTANDSISVAIYLTLTFLLLP